MYISGNDAPEQPHQRLTARTRASRFARTAAPYLAAFAIPFCVLLAAFAMRGIYPFGDVSVMLYDMPVQYAEYFGWLIRCCTARATCCTATPPGWAAACSACSPITCPARST